MDSNFHYSIDLNEDQNHQEHPFFYPLGSSSSSSLLHHPHQVSYHLSSFLINSQEDQHVDYNNTYHLSQPLKAEMFNGGSSSYNHMMPNKETKLKLTIRKKDHRTDFLHQNATNPDSDSDKWMMSPKMRWIKKTIANNKQPIGHTNFFNSTLNPDTNFEEDHDEVLKKVSTRTTTTKANYENGYGNNNGLIRVCSDCNTTKTPLWRSGPRGPKSLCNACGIRQRKARRAAAAAAGDQEVRAARLKQLPVKNKLQSKKKRSNGGDKCYLSPPVVAKVKKFKIKEEEDNKAAIFAGDFETSKSITSSNSSNKLCFEELTIILSKSSAYQQVFPQDEKDAAILLMAMSYGMVR